MVAHVLQETPALAQSALDYVKEGDEEWYQLSLKFININHNNKKLC